MVLGYCIAREFDGYSPWFAVVTPASSTATAFGSPWWRPLPRWLSARWKHFQAAALCRTWPRPVHGTAHRSNDLFTARQSTEESREENRRLKGDKSSTTQIGVPTYNCYRGARCYFSNFLHGYRKLLYHEHNLGLTLDGGRRHPWLVASPGFRPRWTKPVPAASSLLRRAPRPAVHHGLGPVAKKLIEKA